MSAEALYLELKDRLEKVVPDFELRYKAELAYEINRLKAERNAVILGHNYMEPALFFSVPDFTGDSLELCRKAATTDKDPIVFCGVRFMAETAKILNPGKLVLLPAKEAGCSLAASITAEDVRQLKERFPTLVDYESRLAFRHFHEPQPLPEEGTLIDDVDPELKLAPGDTGVAGSTLRPSGKVLLKGTLIDAQSEGGFIERGEKVEIVRVTGNFVFVRKFKENQS